MSKSSGRASSSTSVVSYETRSYELAQARNVDGRPVWEPPIFDYSDLIGEAFEKKKEAVLTFTGGDRVKTTEIMDRAMMKDLSEMYYDWIGENCDAALDRGPHTFFTDLECELQQDLTEDFVLFEQLDVGIRQNEDGTMAATTKAEHRLRMYPHENDLSHEPSWERDDAMHSQTLNTSGVINVPAAQAAHLSTLSPDAWTGLGLPPSLRVNKHRPMDFEPATMRRQAAHTQSISTWKIQRHGTTLGLQLGGLRNGLGCTMKQALGFHAETEAHIELD